MNRGIGTFIGGALGVAAHRLASCFGSEIVEPIILAVSIFIFGKLKIITTTTDMAFGEFDHI
mgnify:FL=1